MILQGKIDRVFKKLHEESDHPDEKLYAESKMKQEEEVEFEKNDFLAMVIAAFLTFLPAALLVLGGLALIGYFLLFH